MVIDQLNGLDIQNYLRNQRPNSALVPYYITNLVFYVYDTNFPLGCNDVTLPDFIKNSKSIKSMLNARNGTPYNDNLCMFRCLYFFRHKEIRSIGVHNLFKQWCMYRGKAAHIESFRGIQVFEIPFFEDCFKVCVNMYTLNSVTEIPFPVYLSTSSHKDVMYLNMYERHVSLVTKFHSYLIKTHKKLGLYDSRGRKINDFSLEVGMCFSHKVIYHTKISYDTNTIFDLQFNI